MEKDLKGKSILYVGVKFFNYEAEIKKMLEALGAQVDFYNERPSNGFFMRLMIRIKLKKLIFRKISAYYKQLINSARQKKYDYVFFVSPETIPEKQMVELRQTQSQAVFILYMWDSFKNKNTGYAITKYFDRIFTFDENDAEKNKAFVFLPLYYLPIYNGSADQKEKRKYDYFLACTMHSDRYSVIKKLKAQVAEKGFSLYSFLFFHSKALFWGRKVLNPNFLFAKKSEYAFAPISQKDITALIAQSKVIIDIQHPEQSGLTNRTFEALGAHKKLITTNQNIKHYDFYNPQNIYIIDRKNPILDEAFLNGAYQKPSDRIYQKYTLANWLRVIFNLESAIT